MTFLVDDPVYLGAIRTAQKRMRVEGAAVRDSFSGGSGSVLKTVAAVLILICLTSGLTMIGMQPYWAMLIKAMVFFAALILDNLLLHGRRA